MGAAFSSVAAPEAPPAVVLVPPLLDSRDRGRSRFAKSPYDRVFAQPQLRALFGDYLQPETRGALRFSPPEDPRVSVTAKIFGPPPALGPPAPHPRCDGHAPASVVDPAAPTGAVTLRYQPDPDSPWTFIDVKARAGGGGGGASAQLRSCAFDPATGLGTFAEMPLAPVVAAHGCSSDVADHVLCGLRYSSPRLSCGAAAWPARGALHSAWAVARAGGLVVGVQTRPDADGLHLPSLLGGGGGGGGWREAAGACGAAASWAAAYQPQGQSPNGRGVFTAVVELRRRRELAISLLHHLAVQRNVRNPLEGADVVGITNYLDFGLQMTADLAPGGGGGGGGGGAMRLAASWQANKNVALKARLGLDGAAAALVVKSWWQPALTLGASASSDLRGGAPRLGLAASVETTRALRYERSGEGAKLAGARVTQRHVAGAEDVAYHRGRGLLVPLEEVDSPEVLGQQRRAGDDCL